VPANRTYEIHEVAALTGLTTDRLRAWERRYDVVRPARSPNGYRAYSADQVALLRAYAKLIERGARIGDLVHRSPVEVIAESMHRLPTNSPLGPLMAAVAALDRDEVEAMVAQQLALRGLRRFADEIVMPLAEMVGDLWVVGELPIAAEHLASEVVIHALKGGLRHGRARGPLAVCACLPGERHEWGFLSALAHAHEAGWRIHYLGTDLPLDEVVGAAWQLSPDLTALSVSDEETCVQSLDRLLSFPNRLPAGTRATIGGGGTRGREAALAAAGFRLGTEAFALDARPMLAATR
jgi:DNA-binding transcriptional MerR regulator